MSDLEVWTVVIALGLVTYLIRFSFLGVIGDRELSPLATTLLKYVPVAVLPALVAPLILFPAATGGEPDAARLAAAGLVIAVGALSGSMFASIGVGMASLWTFQALGL